jgi:hypothetical protein
MDQTITKQDLEFLQWLDSPACEHFWEKDEKGEKILLRKGWDLAQEEYKRLKKLYDNKSFFYSVEHMA